MLAIANMVIAVMLGAAIGYAAMTGASVVVMTLMVIGALLILASITGSFGILLLVFGTFAGVVNGFMLILINRLCNAVPLGLMEDYKISETAFHNIL